MSIDPFTGLVAVSIGGTEQMYSRVSPIMGDKYQIVCSRYRLRNNKKHLILWMHDMAMDPEAYSIFTEENEALSIADAIVFVSHTQYFEYKDHYPTSFMKYASKMHVIPNFTNVYAFETTTAREARNHRALKAMAADYSERKLNFVYHTTPHRGLVHVAEMWPSIKATFRNATLNVHSSYGVYGMPENDAEFKPVFDLLRSQDSVNIHGTLPPSVMAEQLCEYDYFLYPSVWKETSCLAGIECMHAGVFPIATTLGALPETFAGFGTLHKDVDSWKAHVVDDIIKNETIDPYHRQKYYDSVNLVSEYRKDHSIHLWRMLKNKIDSGA